MLPLNVFSDDVLYLDFIVTSVLNEPEKEAYYKIVPCYERCLLFAKENKLQEATKAFNEARLHKNLLTPKLESWMKIFCTSSISYYYYKMRHYQRALRLINESITAIQLLYKNGYQYLFFAEIQQIHNMSRIYFVLNQTEKAIALCVGAVEAVFRQSFLFNTDKMIGNLPEKELINNCQYAMLIQLISETYNRILLKSHSSIIERQTWLTNFTTPLQNINFSSMSNEPRYIIFDEFISFMNKALNSNSRGLTEEDYMRLIKCASINRPLLKVIYNYLSYHNNEI
jgi:tetratricopeptide (TPR) repeat protein